MTLPQQFGTNYAYTVLKVQRTDDLFFTFLAQGASGTIGRFYLCPYLPPFVDNLNTECKFNKTISVGDTFDIPAGSANHYVGYNYFVFSVLVNNFNIQTEVNKRI